MFEEFEVVCPKSKCNAILRLSADGYTRYIKKIDYVEVIGQSNTKTFNFLCVECKSKLKLEIKVSKN